ncbi:MAG TPA: hypothetical protein IGR64_14050 [Leptolyngbyaceae cyanobacterium M65_K2018_010]|nr:hypothetical protein [Leptolyngbyaceae cyanobacterium M65_K2018_010]
MAELKRRYRGLALAATAGVLCLVLGLGVNRVSPGSGTTAMAQTNSPIPTLAPALPMLSGNFEDPQERFQIGIFEGYQVSTAAGRPVFQAPDGRLAYTVAIAPLPAGVALASEADLLNAAQQTFGRGEGFIPGDTQPLPGSGLRMNWTGRLSQGAGPPQPISGKIFARQRDRSVFLLLVAATPAGEAQLADAILTLGSTLKVP